MNAKEHKSFIDRGGWWVLAQVPLLLLAFLIPLWGADAGLVPRHHLQWLGIAIVAIAGALIAAAVFGLGKSLTALPHPHDDATLKTEGIYALMRHPIYAAIVFGVVGWSVWQLSIWGLAYSVPVAIFFDRKAADEERRLRARFEEYEDYARRVRRFIPWLY